MHAGWLAGRQTDNRQYDMAVWWQFFIFFTPGIVKLVAYLSYYPFIFCYYPLCSAWPFYFFELKPAFINPLCLRDLYMSICSEVFFFFNKTADDSWMIACLNIVHMEKKQEIIIRNSIRIHVFFVMTFIKDNNLFNRNKSEFKRLYIWE